MKLSIERIKKDGMYFYNVNVDENGIGLAVLETGTNISGIRLMKNGNHNFNLTKDQFYFLLDNKIIEFSEVLPGFVTKDLRKGFANNLKNHI